MATNNRSKELPKRTLDARPDTVDFRDQILVAMHAALAEVGVLYATAIVHDGWQNVDAHGVIPLRELQLGGHAFAVVAYDDRGFWIQNSWGKNWGASGFALVSYDDWLRNRERPLRVQGRGRLNRETSCRATTCVATAFQLSPG